MLNYLKIIGNILGMGEDKENRTGVKCITTPPQFFEHNMQVGFPLLTNKYVPFKTIAVELEAFIFGITDKEWFKERNCNIWNEWSNPNSDDENDLGPIYGFQWRRFNQPYKKNRERLEPHFDQPYDQLATVIRKLKEDPNDRRLVVSAWNPLQMKDMALPPCHFCLVFQHLNGKLSLNWSQRSVDTFLGLPFNIASYALLLELVARETGLTPHMLTGNLVDVHIYQNHTSQCSEMMNNETYPLPQLELTNLSIWNWDHTQARVLNYKSHGKIKAEVAV